MDRFDNVNVAVAVLGLCFLLGTFYRQLSSAPAAAPIPFAYHFEAS
jgi:hypothetical protein